MNSGEITNFLFDIVSNLVIAVVIFFVGFWLAKQLSRAVAKLLQKRESDANLVTFVSHLVRGLVKTIVVVVAITQLGIEMTSIVALLGAAGLAIGMAFSGTLSNFAGGIMILLFKPFRSGDFVRVQGEEGIVKEVTIFNTILTTPDNKVIILPNGPVANGNIVNFTKADKRRVDWTFGIAYGDDLKKAKELLQEFIAQDKRILTDPGSLVALGALADSSVNITVRAWVNTADYWDVFFAMNERVYSEFGSHGLNIPFPQVDVHLKQD